MISTKNLLRPLAAAALLAVAGASQAALTAYSSEAAFLAAVSNAGTDTFDDLALGGAIEGPLARTAGSHSYETTVVDTAGAPGLFYPAGTPADVWLSTNVALDTIVFNNFSSGVSAVGGFFFGSDIAGEFLPGQAIRLVATDGDGSVTQTILNTTPSSFLGFVSNGAMLSLTVTALQPDDSYTWPTVNQLTLAQAVPEPGTYALMFAGLGVLGLLARRRA